MKMIILGAGASFDSINLDGNFIKNHPKGKWRPPLGKNLFSYQNEYSQIIKKYKGAEAIRSEVNLCSDIEDLFQEKYDLSDSPNGSNYLLQIISVQFYLQELFYKISKEYIDFGPSNYDNLVAKAYKYIIETKEEILIVTFNYDFLLEESIEKNCNIKFNSLNDYISHNIKLFKPHGSCNWFKTINVSERISGALQGTGIPDYLYDPKNIDKTYEILNSLSSGFKIADNKYDKLKPDQRLRQLIMPQILIPLRTKGEFVMPDSHLKKLANLLQYVNEILVIGWKAGENHFIQLLKENIKADSLKILYVCGQDRTIESKLKDIVPDTKFIRFSKSARRNDKPVRLSTFSLFSKEIEHEFLLYN